MRLTLGTPAEAGCGFGAISGTAAAVITICVTPRENFNELAVLLIPVYLVWFTLFGGICGRFGASIRRAPLAAAVGASIAVMPLMIARLCLLFTEPHTILPIHSVELILATIGAFSGLVGNLIGTRLKSRDSER